MNVMNSRAWQPGTWITPTGIVLCPRHVKTVCTVAQNEAVEATTKALKKMMQVTK